MDKIILAIGLGTPELLLILAVVILLFGASRLPQLAKSLGKSKRAFREGQEEAEEEEPARPVSPLFFFSLPPRARQWSSPARGDKIYPTARAVGIKLVKSHKP